MKNKILYYIITPISVLVSTLFAMALQPIIDNGIAMDWKAFFTAVCVAVMLCCLDIILCYFSDYLIDVCKAEFIVKLRIHYYDRIFQEDVSCFGKKNSSFFITSLTSKPEQISEKYFENGLNIYKSIWSLVISVVAILFARWELSLYIIVFSLISVYLPKTMQKQSDDIETKFMQADEKHLMKVREVIRNYMPIKMFGIIAGQRNQYKSSVNQIKNIDLKRSKKKNLMNAFATGISELSFVLIIVFSMILVMQGKLSVGYIMSVSQLLGGIMFPFEVLPGYIMDRKSGRKLMLEQEEALQNEIQSNKSGKILPAAPKQIQFDHVDFIYDNGFELQDIQLALDTNKKYAVIGHSGSGKSTIAKLIIGMLHPASGKILLDGQKLSDIDETSLFNYMNYHNQEVTLFDASIEYNVALQKPYQSEQMQKVIKKAHLEDFIRRQKQHEHTYIDDDGKNISGGEKQRIAIARSLASNAVFTVFDECLASLDNITAKAIEKDLLKQNDMGILMITHRIFEENMQMYDCVIVMENGKIIEMGNWKDLKSKSKFAQT